MFYGRVKELQQLNSRYSGKRKEFGVIYGRRRIGKTEMVKTFINGKKGVFFQAKRDNAYGNLRSFSYELDKLFGLPKSFVFSSWEEALDAVKEHFKDERFYLIIDEYPFIVSQDESFSSVIQAFFDHMEDNLFLLLLGSDVSFLRNEIKDKNSPLYKRRTFEIELSKLNFSEALLFLDGMKAEDKCNYLSLMSGYPYYLAAINKDIGFEDNIQNLLFNQFGTFFDLPDQLLSNSTNVQDVYNAILLSIAYRHYTLKDISADIHEEDSKVSKYILTLLNNEIIEKRETFKGTRRTHYYVIADPMLRFWYKFIFVNQEHIKTNGKYVFEEVKEQIYLFLSHAFEDTAILYLDELNADGKLGSIFPHIQNFRADKTKLNRSVEIDGLAQSGNTLIVVECKYKKEKFTNAMMAHLEESASIFAEKLDRQYYIFSKSGFAEDFKSAENIHCFDLYSIFS